MGMTPQEKRIFDRAVEITERDAERRERVAAIRAEIAAKWDQRVNEPTAAVRWNAAVAEGIEAGMRRDQAVIAANRNNPGLREKYVAEVNAAGRSVDRSPKAEAKRTTIVNAVAKWKSAIEQNIAAGMSRPNAARAANRQNPGLREAMLAKSQRV